MNNNIVEDGTVDIRGTTDKQWLFWIDFAGGYIFLMVDIDHSLLVRTTLEVERLLSSEAPIVVTSSLS